MFDKCGLLLRRDDCVDTSVAGRFRFLCGLFSNVKSIMFEFDLVLV